MFGIVNLWEEYLKWCEEFKNKVKVGGGFIGLLVIIRECFKKFEEFNID